MRLLINLPILACLASIAIAAMHQVAVGQNGLVFTPNTTTAAVGDNVVFTFYPRDHNVVQGPFDMPCQSGDGTGIYSGFVPSSSGPANRTFEITINNTTPIWFYCSQVSHCTSGMVGVINPPSGNANTNLESYAAAAKNVASSSYSHPAEVHGGVLAASGGNTGPSSSSVSMSSMSASMSSSITGTGNGGAGGTSATGTGTASATAASRTNAAALGAKVEGWGVGAILGGLAVAFL